jgi:hypothetical protein
MAPTTPTYIHNGRVVSTMPGPAWYQWPLIVFWAVLEALYHFFASLCHGAPPSRSGVIKQAPKPWWQKPPPPSQPRNLKDLGSMSNSASCAPGGG